MRAPDGGALTPSGQATPDGTLLKALARAWRWQKLLDASVYTWVTEIVEAEQIGKSYIRRILRLALLAPDIVEAVLSGRTDQALMLERLERPLPASWAEQRRVLRAGAAERLTASVSGWRPDAGARAATDEAVPGRVWRGATKSDLHHQPIR